MGYPPNGGNYDHRPMDRAEAPGKHTLFGQLVSEPWRIKGGIY
jgi:hypothetical protein